MSVHLLTLPTNSPVLYRLGASLGREKGSSIPLLYPTLMCFSDSYIHYLSRKAPTECQNPPQYVHPPWKCCTGPDCLTIKPETYKGDAWKAFTSTMIKTMTCRTTPFSSTAKPLAPTQPRQTQPGLVYTLASEMGWKLVSEQTSWVPKPQHKMQPSKW